LITTAKDAIKIAGRIGELGPDPLYTLEVGLDIEPGFDDCWRTFLAKSQVL